MNGKKKYKEKVKLHDSSNKIKKINKLHRVEKQKLIRSLSLKNQINNTNQPEIVKTFANMTLDRKKRRYLEKEKEIALGLYFKSPSYYSFLREIGFDLPCKTTINRWIPIKNVDFGINMDIFEQINAKFQDPNIPDEDKVCAIVEDEIHIRSELEYNAFMDRMDGICTDGLERENLIGREICVFMLRGLLSSWSFIVGHVISNTSISGEKIENNISKILNLYSKTNVDIRAIVCDQGPNNRKFYKNMGATETKPYFSFNEKKIYTFFCTPQNE